MTKNYVNINNLKVSSKLSKFINEELLVGTDVSPDKFWSGLDKSVHELAPKNRELLEKRDNLQKKLMNGIKKIEMGK